MAIPTRLTAVVKIREREEERTEKALADANESHRRAQAALQLAQQRALRSDLKSGSAADWEMREVGKFRDREDVKKAKAVTVQTELRQKAAIGELGVAHRRTEVVRRVADARDLEARKLEEKREQKDTDEFVMLRFGNSKR